MKFSSIKLQTALTSFNVGRITRAPHRFVISFYRCRSSTSRKEIWRYIHIKNQQWYNANDTYLDNHFNKLLDHIKAILEKIKSGTSPKPKSSNPTSFY